MTSYLDNLNKVSQLLKNDKVILCPTDSIWGLSCTIYSEDAFRKIYHIKKRDVSKPLIILVDGLSMLKKYVEDLHPRVETLLLHYNKPLTIVHKASPAIPSYLLCNGHTIAVRITQSEMLRDLISTLGNPIVSTSANVQGESNPNSYAAINSEIVNQVDYIFQSGREIVSQGIASTLVRYSKEGELFFLR